MLKKLFNQSKLIKALDKFEKSGCRDDDILSGISDEEVKTALEARRIAEVIQQYLLSPPQTDSIFSPLHRLIAFFQQVKTQAALDVLKTEGLPVLRQIVQQAIAGQAYDEDDVMMALKILAMYQQAEDAAVVAQAVRSGFNPDGYLWSIILNMYRDAPPDLALQLIDALRNPLPNGFIRIAYLDIANQLAIAGNLPEHPFNTAEGMHSLQQWLENQDPDEFSYAHSAAASLPFIAEPGRTRLVELALAHPDVNVKLETAWAQAKLGVERGITTLIFYAANPVYSRVAQNYLEELGLADKIPQQAREPDFLALAEMSQWLSHPGEFGRFPDQVEIVDQRRLFWPPTQDNRDLWLVRYVYEATAEQDYDEGLGLVGSVTFCLFGQNTMDKSAEDMYALHCSWELEYSGEQVKEGKEIEYGRQRLREHNEGF